MKIKSTHLLFSLLLLNFVYASAADWPMWRHDAGRSAVTDEKLPDNLRLQWSRTLSTPRQAWRDLSNVALYFDATYEPIVMGDTLFVCSMNNDSICAYSTDSGKEKGKFFADGLQAKT